MISPEVLPAAGGIILGSIAHYAYSRTHRWSYVLGILLLALCATVASGEFRQSWGFLIADVVIVSLAACGAFLVLRLIVSRRKPSER